MAKKRIAKILKDFPGAIEYKDSVRIDTVITEKIVKIYVKDTAKAKATFDSLGVDIDSLLSTFKDCKDTVIFKEIVKEVKKTVYKRCQVDQLLSAMSYDTLGVRINVTPIGNALKIEVISQNLTISKDRERTGTILQTEPEFYEISWFWWFVGACVVILLLLYFQAIKSSK
jgi:hypothetical protein